MCSYCTAILLLSQGTHVASAVVLRSGEIYSLDSHPGRDCESGLVGAPGSTWHARTRLLCQAYDEDKSIKLDPV